MSFMPNFHAIRQDLFQLFEDIERDLGLEPFPQSSSGQRLLKDEQSKSSPAASQSQSTTVASQDNTQLSTVDFSKPLAANFKINDEGDKWVATGDFPGVKAEDLHISVRNGMLTLDARRGCAKERRSDTNQSYSYSSSQERVARTIPLPNGVEEKGVKTEFKDGHLQIILAKNQQTMQSERQQGKQQGQTAANQQQQPTRQGA